MRVLIVDDEALIRKCLGRVALSRGHIVRTGRDGTEGLKIWRRFQPHLVFLDVLLPGLSGPAVLQQSGKNNNEKVVMMSAHKACSDGASLSGVDMFLSKPFQDIEKVFKQVELLCKGVLLRREHENHLRPL